MRPPQDAPLGAWRRSALLTAVGVATVAAGCAVISTDPDVAVSIEAAPLAFPAIALGDSLRDTLGVAQPVRAIVRNSSGESIADSSIRYLYRQQDIDSALVVDSVTGHVVARALPSSSLVQIAARFGNTLQVLIPVRVTQAPDTVFQVGAAEVRVFIPLPGEVAVDENSAEVVVRVQSRDSTDALQNTSDWLVEFTVVDPPNPTNDTTASVFLIEVASARPSRLDTTTNGDASRRVRVRPREIEVPDTVAVQALVRRRGELIAGAPVTIRVPVVSRDTSTTTDTSGTRQR